MKIISHAKENILGDIKSQSNNNASSKSLKVAINGSGSGEANPRKEKESQKSSTMSAKEKSVAMEKKQAEAEKIQVMHLVGDVITPATSLHAIEASSEEKRDVDALIDSLIANASSRSLPEAPYVPAQSTKPSHEFITVAGIDVRSKSKTTMINAMSMGPNIRLSRTQDARLIGPAKKRPRLGMSLVQQV
eukprot:IDg14321t1